MVVCDSQRKMRETVISNNLRTLIVEYICKSIGNGEVQYQKIFAKKG